MDAAVQRPFAFLSYHPHFRDGSYSDNSLTVTSDVSTGGNSSTSTTTTCVHSATASNRECIFFPTYAMRNPQDASEWIVQSKGWVLSHGRISTKDKLAMSITKSFAGQGSADLLANRLYQQRFKYFLAKNKRNKQFRIHTLGTMSLEEHFVTDSIEHPLEWPEDVKSDAPTMSVPFLPAPHPHCRETSLDAGMEDETGTLSFSSCRKPVASDDETMSSDKHHNSNNNNNNNNNMEHWPVADQFFRPSNPLSTVLDGVRRPSSMLSAASTPSIPSVSSGSVHSSNTWATLVCGDHTVSVKTESNGCFHGQWIIPHAQVVEWAKHQDRCDARLIRIRSESRMFAPSLGTVNLVEPHGISIISDIDDTIKDTQILAGPRAVVANTFFKANKAVDGMAETYMRWYAQGASFHYVSNSPFQLMRMLEDFLKQNAFPPGSMHLRVDGSLLARLIEVPGRAKRDAILQILHDFPHRQFILIGDSGEIDLEIYARIASEHPGRIVKILIRNVSPEKMPRRNTLSNLFKRTKPDQTPDGPRPMAATQRSTSLPNLPALHLTNLQSRVSKAEKQAGVKIVVFRDAETIRSDKDIRQALWNTLDNAL